MLELPPEIHRRQIAKMRKPGLRDKIRVLISNYPDKSYTHLAAMLDISPQLVSYYARAMGNKPKKQFPGRLLRCCVCGSLANSAGLVCNTRSCNIILEETRKCEPENRDFILRIFYENQTRREDPFIEIPNAASICTRGNMRWFYRSLRDHVKSHAYRHGNRNNAPAAFAKFRLPLGDYQSGVRFF